jgi:hypothetical protein
MARRSPVTHDAEAILETLAARVAKLSRHAAQLDDLERREEAADARIQAANLAHLLNMLRSPIGGPAGTQATPH